MSDSKYSKPPDAHKRKAPPAAPFVEDEKEEAERSSEPNAKRARGEEKKGGGDGNVEEEEEEQKREGGRWSDCLPDDMMRRVSVLSINCHQLEGKADKNQLSAEETQAFASAIPMCYEWLSSNFISACRIKIDTRGTADELYGNAPSDDVVDVSEEERHEGAPIRLSMMELIMITMMQCMRMDSDERVRMRQAYVKFEESCLKKRRDPRMSREEKMEAILHRVRREIFTFHHAWRVDIDYNLVAKAQMRSHAELYEFELTEQQLADFYKRNPQYLVERKRLDEQPKPRIYRDQILESERKANPALELVWGLGRDDLIWLCASWLADMGATKLNREMCDFIHACSWFLFHINFCSQLWSMYPSQPLTAARESQLDSMRINLIKMVVESLSLDRDAEMRDSSEGITFRMSAPVGTNEYFIGNHEFDVDRHHSKLQKICNWLEPTKLLQEAWLASIRAVADVLPADALMSHAMQRFQSASSASASAPEFPDILAMEVHFYQSFCTMARFLCQIDVDDYVIFGADVMGRYSKLSEMYDSILPITPRRPQIVCFARKCGVRMGNRYHECTYLWQACMLWLVLLEENFYGTTSDGKKVHNLAQKLGLAIKQEPRPKFLQSEYGQPLPTRPGGSSEVLEDPDFPLPSSPPAPPAPSPRHFSAPRPAPLPPRAASAAAAGGVGGGGEEPERDSPSPRRAVGSLDDID